MLGPLHRERNAPPFLPLVAVFSFSLSLSLPTAQEEQGLRRPGRVGLSRCSTPVFDAAHSVLISVAGGARHRTAVSTPHGRVHTCAVTKPSTRRIVPAGGAVTWHEKPEAIRAIMNHDSPCKDEPEVIRAIMNHDSLCMDESEVIRAIMNHDSLCETIPRRLGPLCRLVVHVLLHEL